MEHSGCSADNDLRVLSANVHVTNRRVDELLRLVDRTKPAVVLLMETGAWWHEHVQALRERHPYVVEQVDQGP
jgi:endonuclease/exonuclease/phosphatase (EEP) superfamily protein YafD